MHWKIPRVTEEQPPPKQATAVICHAVHRNSLTREKQEIETTRSPAELCNGSKDRIYWLKESHTNVPRCRLALLWSVIKQVTSVFWNTKAFVLFMNTLEPSRHTLPNTQACHSSYQEQKAR